MCRSLKNGTRRRCPSCTSYPAAARANGNRRQGRLARRTIVASTSTRNPQAIFGDDVISRIGAVREDAGALSRLQRMAVSAVDWAIGALCRRAQVAPESITEAVALVQPQANNQRVIIRTALSHAVPAVVADLRSIKQIALNILSNAIRFTPSGGQIVVSTAYEANGSVVLRIRDTGVGMTRSELEQAMKPFRQVTTGARKRGDGTQGHPDSTLPLDGGAASA